MSRSYKKVPIVKDYNRGEKKLANRRVKSLLKQDPDAIGQNGNYKKSYPQYAISDYAFIMTKEDALAWYEKFTSESVDAETREYVLKLYPTLEDYLIHWQKTYLRK